MNMRIKKHVQMFRLDGDLFLPEIIGIRLHLLELFENVPRLLLLLRV